VSSEAAYFPDALATTAEVRESDSCESEIPSELFEQAQISHDLPDRSSGGTTAVSEVADETLLERVGRGSKDALAHLFRRHRRTVSNVALRILKDASEAEDLCQEAFIFVFQRAKLFDASKGTAISWIIQIAYHRAINRRRYLTVRQHYNAQELDEEQIASDRQHLSIDDIDARKLLNRFQDQLTADQRYTLELHFFEGYSFREIAEKMGQTLENTRHHFYRGLERLRSCVFPQKRV
jgi:RNA polymerase sigma-70 factor (ECF subfamily)